MLSALLVSSLVVGSLSGIGLALAALGFARQRGWRQRVGVWLPPVFGLSIVVAATSFVLLLVSGID